VLEQTPKVELASRERGPSSGLQQPRIVSQKADEVNLRRGPACDHGIARDYRRAVLPVEVIAEFVFWRHGRDSVGDTCWVVGSLLSGRRSVLVAPWEEKNRVLDLHFDADQFSAVSARLSPGVLGDVENCDGNWCRILAGSVTGYLEQKLMWGVYPEETVN
jgi:SH3-like domain-containing protein